MLLVFERQNTNSDISQIGSWVEMITLPQVFFFSSVIRCKSWDEMKISCYVSFGLILWHFGTVKYNLTILNRIETLCITITMCSFWKNLFSSVFPVNASSVLPDFFGRVSIFYHRKCGWLWHLTVRVFVSFSLLL